MNKVPVTLPKELAWVSKEIREESLKALVAGPQPEDSFRALADSVGDDFEQQLEGKAVDELMQNNMKKRKLYRQATGTDQVGSPLKWQCLAFRSSCGKAEGGVR